MFSYPWHASSRTVKGYRPKSFPPDRLSPFSKSRFFSHYDTASQAGARFVGLHGRPSGFLELVSHPVVRKFNHLSLEVHTDTNLFVFDLFAQSSKHL